MSPRRVWALTWLAIQDSLRRRVVIVFVVFIVVLSFAGWFLDPGSEHPLRLYISFVLTSTSYLVLLLVLFLSALSLPTDLKSEDPAHDRHQAGPPERNRPGANARLHGGGNAAAWW